MKSVRILVIAALLAVGFSATGSAATFVFRNTPNNLEALGVLEASPSDWGYGILVCGGYRFRLTGFDCWMYSWVANHPDQHMCLIIHPFEPWVMGFMLWRGCEGKFDILSTDCVRFEGEMTVLRIGEEPRAKGS
jgi:hypothetical protein